MGSRSRDAPSVIGSLQVGSNGRGIRSSYQIKIGGPLVVNASLDSLGRQIHERVVQVPFVFRKTDDGDIQLQQISQ